MVFSLTTTIVFGPPQLKVTLPPPPSRPVKAASLQLAGEPFPTTPAACANCGDTTANMIGTITAVTRTTTNQGFACMGSFKAVKVYRRHDIIGIYNCQLM